MTKLMWLYMLVISTVGAIAGSILMVLRPAQTSIWRGVLGVAIMFVCAAITWLAIDLIKIYRKQDTWQRSAYNRKFFYHKLGWIYLVTQAPYILAASIFSILRAL